MKVLKIDLERLFEGFKAATILDSYIYNFNEKYVNNVYRESVNDKYLEFEGITEIQRFKFLLLGVEVNLISQESLINPDVRDYFLSYSKLFAKYFDRFKNGEKIDNEILFYLYFLYKNERKFFNKELIIKKLLLQIDFDFFYFFITIINSLRADDIKIDKYDSLNHYKDLNNIPIIGIMDKISGNQYKKELSFRQKYVIISKLIMLYFKKIKISNDNLFESGLHYIIFRLIDKKDEELDYLQEIGRDNGYSAFLNSKLFRSPMSAKATKEMFDNIEYLYQKKDILETVAVFELHGQILNKSFEFAKKNKRKEWKKQEFINALKKYKNQSEMAKACGVSRQRISELKKKFKIK